MISRVARRALLSAMTCAAMASGALAQGGNVVISQVYGGGGFVTLGPKYDLVELFNRTNAPINLAGWSVQVGSALANPTWLVVPLTGTIPARGYYLVRTGQTFSATTGIDYTYDDSANPLLDVSAFTSPAGRVALVNNSTALATGSCPVGQTGVIDFFSWGTTATCFEGSGPGPAGSTTPNPPINPIRRLNGCQDTNDNAADFTAPTFVAFRSSASPPVPSSDFLGASAGAALVAPGTNITLTANMQTCGGTLISLTGVTGNLAAFGLTGTEAFSASMPPTPGPWTYVLSVPLSQSPGDYSVQVTGTDGTNSYNASASFRVTALPPANDLCANAVAMMSLPQTYVVDISGATSDLDPGTCNTGTVGNFGVWYRFDATSNGTLSLNETSTTVVAYGIWVTPTLGATCPTTTPATTCSTTQNLNVAVTAGNTYYIQVGQSGTTLPTAPINLTATFTPPAANDECSGAIAINAGMFTMNNTSSTTSAAPLNSLPCPTTASSIFNDVWYKWTAPGNGRFAIVSNLGNAGRYAVYDGGPGGGVCPTTATPLMCQSTGTALSNNAAAPFVAVAGNTYFIQYGTTTSTSTQGALDCELQFDPDPSGACCITATCVLTPPQLCAGLGGVYQGDGSLCAPTTSTVNTYAGTGGAIPDFVSPNAGVFTSSLNVTDTFPVNGIEVDLTMSHTFNGDLVIRLSKSPQPTFVMHYRGRRGVSGTTNLTADFVGAYTFSDGAATSIFDFLGTGAPTTIPIGTYRTAGVAGISRGFTETFNGISSNGTWTLSITDNAAGDTGTVTSWALKLRQGGASPCSVVTTGRCCVGSRCVEGIDSAACDALATAPAGRIFTSGATGCNATGVFNTPCCFADYNKLGGIGVQDIFDFLAGWFANSPNANVQGDGSAPGVQDIFDFLSAWFGGGC